MSLETRIMADLKTAMKQKDQAALRTIRSIKAAILLQKTDGSGKELDEEGEIKLVQKLVKQRKDSKAGGHQHSGNEIKAKRLRVSRRIQRLFRFAGLTKPVL